MDISVPSDRTFVAALYSAQKAIRLAHRIQYTKIDPLVHRGKSGAEIYDRMFDIRSNYSQLAAVD